MTSDGRYTNTLPLDRRMAVCTDKCGRHLLLERTNELQDGIPNTRIKKPESNV